MKWLAPYGIIRRPINRSTRLFFRYSLNNILLLLLPLLVGLVYFGLSSTILGSVIDEFAEAQLVQSISAVDREFGEIQQMVVFLSEDPEVNFYLASDGDFSDLEFYQLRGISNTLMPSVFGSPMVSHLLLYLHRSSILISESGFGTYRDYYGSVFSFAGFNSTQWRDIFLLSPRSEELTGSRLLNFSGSQSAVRLYRRNIGFGDFYLGSVIAVISEEGLRSMLATMPARYGGWVEILDQSGNLIVSTVLPGVPKPDLRSFDPSQRSIQVDGQRLRLFRRESSVNGWVYTAALNETLILAELQRMTQFALGLLFFGLVIGLMIAYVLAFKTTQPWNRVFDLVYQQLGEADGTQDIDGFGQEIDRAIDILASKSLRMQAEVKVAEQVTKVYYLQNVIKGVYRTKEEFLRAGKDFGLELPETSCQVVLIRMSPSNLLTRDEPYQKLREAVRQGLEQQDLSHGLVPISFDDFGLVRFFSPGSDVHSEIQKLIERLQGSIPQEFRGQVVLGVGEPVDEPFLLTLSLNQAHMAVSSGDDQKLIRYYRDISISQESYTFPLDVEEGFIRGVKSGNIELVLKVLDRVYTENFEQRRLTEEEIEYLFVELKGSLLKLFKAYPEPQDLPQDDLASWWTLIGGPEKFNQFRTLARTMAERYDSQKRSHNSVLLGAIQEYLTDHYSDPSLSMTTLSDTFNRTESYLSSFFKEQTDVRLSDYLLKLRMDKAQELLRDGFLNVDQIAQQCGYQNTSSFRRAFKRQFGVAPSDFRERRPIIQ
jgi:two-component system response regulator YesN